MSSSEVSCVTCDLRTLHDAAIVASDQFADVQIAWGKNFGVVTGAIRVQSTNNCVAYQRFVEAEVVEGDRGEMLIPRHAILQFCKLVDRKRWDMPQAVTIRHDARGLTFTMVGRSCLLNASASVAQFPDVDSVIPTKFEMKLTDPISFDPKLMRLVAKINRGHRLPNKSHGQMSLVHATDPTQVTVWQISHRFGAPAHILLMPLMPQTTEEEIQRG